MLYTKKRNHSCMDQVQHGGVKWALFFLWFSRIHPPRAVSFPRKSLFPSRCLLATRIIGYFHADVSTHPYQDTPASGIPLCMCRVITDKARQERQNQPSHLLITKTIPRVIPRHLAVIEGAYLSCCYFLYIISGQLCDLCSS